MTNEIRYRGANMGFVLFNQNTNNDDKNIETNFIFAHEVAAGYYGDTYHYYDEDEDYSDDDNFKHIEAELFSSIE